MGESETDLAPERFSNRGEIPCPIHFAIGFGQEILCSGPSGPLTLLGFNKDAKFKHFKML